MDAEKVRESLGEFVATLETLLELAPDASPQQLMEYAKGVVASPVAAAVLVAALATPVKEEPTARRGLVAKRLT